MRIILSLCYVFLIQTSYAQISLSAGMSNTKKITVSGRVVDSTGRYLPYAHVVFTHQKTKQKVAVATEAEGYFSAQLTPGLYAIEASFIGFVGYTQTYSLLKDTVLHDIVLTEKSEQLDEVVIKADIEKDIEHSAIGMTFNIKNDSLYKKLSVAQVLSYLPGVQVDENGRTTLEGDPATIMLNGRPQRLTTDLLMMLLENMQGDQIENIELISTPSAKYSGRVQKIIDINLKKQRKDGLLGSISTTIRNVDFSITSSAGLNYKTGKFIFSGSALPYSYSKRTRSFFMNRQLIDNSLSFKEEQKNIWKSNRDFYRFGIDYTINKQHSVWAYIMVNNGNGETQNDFSTNQFAFDNITNTQWNANKVNSDTRHYNVDLAYRYDIGDKGARLDIASNFGQNNSDLSNSNTNELVDAADSSVVNNRNRDNQTGENKQFSTRLDYLLPLKDKKGNFEAGLKYDDLFIADHNIFENFNAADNSYGVDLGFTNSFEYQEQVYTAYTSLSSNDKKLKYSLGLRLEHVETQSFSATTNQTFSNTFTNFLPVIVFKYMTNEKQTSNVNLSYRKGYRLPPYVQLNPFEVFVNSNTIKRGNPELTQSIYHLFGLKYTIKNKYFLSLSANFYENQFLSTQILENDITVTSYQNLGGQSLYRFKFNTRFTVFPWWRLNISAGLVYRSIISERVNNEIITYNASLDNTFTLPGSFILRVSSSFNNGASSGPDTPNKFIRVYSNASLSKRFLKDKALLSIRVFDIFGVANKNESTYTIDDTIFSRRVVLQRPLISLSLSYRFSSGEKINKKNKKKSGVNGSRF